MQAALVPFHGALIPTARIEGIVFVAMKSVAQAVGLDWSGQRQRIMRHPVLSASVVMITTEGRSRDRRSLMLPISMLHGWLFTVDASRVRLELRDSLKTYQRECFEVLDAYWRRGWAANPRLRTIADGERPHDGLGKTTGERFAEERAKFEAREGVALIKWTSGTGLLSAAKLRAIEKTDGRIDDTLFRWLIGLGFDLNYVLYGKRLLTESERAVRDMMRMADDHERAELIAHAETISIEVRERRDAYGAITHVTDRHGAIVDQTVGALLN